MDNLISKNIKSKALLTKGSYINNIVSVLLAIILVVGLMPSLSSVGRAYADDSSETQATEQNEQNAEVDDQQSGDEASSSGDESSASDENTEAQAANELVDSLNSSVDSSSEEQSDADAANLNDNQNSAYYLQYFANNGSRGSDGNGLMDKYGFDESQVVELPNVDNTNVVQYASDGYKLLGFTTNKDLPTKASEAAKQVVDELVRSQADEATGKIAVASTADANNIVKSAEDGAFSTIKSVLKAAAQNADWDIENYDSIYEDETPTLYDYYFYKAGQQVYAEDNCDLYAVWIPDINKNISVASVTDTAANASLGAATGNGLITRLVTIAGKVEKTLCEEIKYNLTDDTVVVKGYYYIDEYFFGDKETGQQNWNPVVSNSIRVEGECTLVIKDGVTLTIDAGDSDRAGICCACNSSGSGSNNKLTITCGCDIDGVKTAPDGSGKIICYGGSGGGAGIGGTRHLSDSRYIGNNITIDGGIVEAHGGGQGAGIGGAKAGGGKYITINGGDVWAYGGEKAAGIGAGDDGQYHAKTHDITINGGTVHAYGSAIKYHDDAGGCGIGGSNNAQEVYKIKVTGGSVYAYGGPRSAGIGAGQGQKADDRTSSATYMSFTGGYIYAEGGDQGSGIGAGRNGNGHADISGGVIDAYGNGGAAGIGGGRGRYWTKTGAWGEVTLSGGVINASSYASSEHPDEKGAGIGGGYEGTCNVKVKPVSASNKPIVWAYGAFCGIGNGYKAKLSTSEYPVIYVYDNVVANVVKRGHENLPQEVVPHDSGEIIKSELEGYEYVTINYPDMPIVNYVDKEGNLTSHVATPIKEDDTKLEWTPSIDGFYYVDHDMTIDHTLVCKGSVKLIIPDWISLTVSDTSNAGIGLDAEDSDNNTFVLYGQTNQTGKLKASGVNGAGIGGYTSGSMCRGVEIAGCDVEATSTNGCGIGGSESGAAWWIGFYNNCKVKATGGSGSAGIGSGADKFLAEIDVYNGHIEAWGGDGAAGIGTGSNSASVAKPLGKYIVIKRGTVIGHGGANAAGIGGGNRTCVTGIQFNDAINYAYGYAGACTLAWDKWPDAIGAGAEGKPNPDVHESCLNGDSLHLWIGKTDDALIHENTTGAPVTGLGRNINSYLNNVECALVNHFSRAHEEISISYQKNSAIYGDPYDVEYDVSGCGDIWPDDVHWYSDKSRTEEVAAPRGLNTIFSSDTLRLVNETDNWTDAGTYYFDIVYSNNGLTTKSNVATFQISKRPVSVTSGSASKEYDGTALTCDTVEIGGKGWAKGEEVTCTASGSQTEVGSSKNTLSLVKPESFKDSNYDISINEGTLTVRPVSTPLVITANSTARTYDGTALTGQESGYAVTSGSLFGDDQIKDVVISGQITDSGAATTHIESYKIENNGADVKNHYSKIDVVDGTIKVEPRQVTLMSQSKTKDYDGTALTGQLTDIVVGGDGFALSEEEGITYTMTGSQFVVGTSDNSFTYTISDPIKEQNYIIEQKIGTLTVNACEAQITLTANSANKKYDGSTLEDRGFKCEGQLQNGDNVDCVVEGSQLDAGIGDNTIITYKIINGEEDVTACYSNVTLKNGSLVVTKRNVVLSSGSAVQEYNGQTLTNSEVVVSGDGFADGQGATFSVTGSQTNAGSSDNNFTYKLNTGTKDDNYSISCVKGSLTVAKHVVNMFTKSKVEVKSEEGQTVASPGVWSDSNFDNQFSDELFLSELADGQVHTNAQATEVKTPVKNDVSYSFKQGFSEDNYTINKDEGILLLASEDSPLSGISYSGVYDGAEHKGSLIVPDGATITNAQFSVDGEGWISDIPTIKDVGTKNIVAKADITIGGITKSDVETNYSLTVTQRQVNLTSASAEKTYDGTELTKHEVIVSGDGFVDSEKGGISYTFTGSQLVAGSSDNDFDYILREPIKSTNYYIEKSKGTLTVSACQTAITLTANSANKKYDGNALADAGYSQDGVVQSSDIIECTVEGTQTDAGKSENVITNYKILHGQEDVTACYNNITLKQGTLVVSKRNVLLTSGSGEQEYNGKALTCDEVKATGDGFVAGQGAAYSVTGSQTSAGSSDNNFTYTLNSGTKAENYNINCIYGTLTVSKHAVSMYTKSKIDVKSSEVQSVTAPGVWSDSQFAAEFSDTLFLSELTDGQVHTDAKADVVDTIVDNVVTYTFKPGYSVDNYIINKTEGVLFLASQEKPLLGESYSGIYDGQNHYGGVIAPASATVTNLVYSEDGGQTYSAIQPYIKDVGEKTINAKADVTVSGKTIAASTTYTLCVTPRQVTLTSASAEKAYDGTALINHDISVQGDGFVESEKSSVSYTYKGSQLVAGSSDNSFDYILGAAIKSQNYNIEKSFGTLTVTAYSEAITITANSDTKMYDGSELSDNKYSIEGSMQSGDILTCTIEGSITDVGTCDNIITNYKVTHNGTEDVTNSYSNIATHNGSLVVTKRKVIFTSGSAKQEYNGNALTKDQVDESGDGFVAGQGATYSVTGTQTSAGSSANSFTYSLNAGTNPDNYSINCSFGTLTVTKHTVNMYTKSRVEVKTYEGQTVSAPGVWSDAEFATEFNDTLFLSELVDSQVHTNAVATEVKKPVKNVVSYTFKDGYSEDNYTVNKDEGILLLASDDSPLAGISYYGVYDGQEHKGDVVVPDGVSASNKQFSVDGGITWTSEIPTIKNVGKINVNAKADITVGQTTKTVETTYSLQVVARPVVLVSYSAEKTYDGTPLTKPEVSILGDGFVGDEASATAVGSVLDVADGYVVNSIVVTENSGFSSENYNISKQEGTLKINSKQDTIIVAASSASKIYDAEKLESSSFAYTPGILVSEDAISATVSGSIIDAGATENKIEDVKICRNGKDITSNYTITTVNGTLEVIQRAVIMRSESGIWAYDGNPHSKENVNIASTAVSGFVGDQGVDKFSEFPTITDAGVCKNTYSYSLKVNTNPANYKITQLEGNLVVTKYAKPIAIVADSASKEYDGTALSIAGDGYKVYGEVPSAFNVEVQVSAKTEGVSITDAGTINNDVISYKITKNGEDVTSNFSTVKAFSGVLQVQPRNVCLVSDSSSKIYDAQELTKQTVTGERFVAGQGATYDFSGSQTSAGESDNEFTYTLNGGTNANNYNITTEFGKLTVNKRPITLYSKSASKRYDGTELTAPGVFSDPSCTTPVTDSVFLNELSGEEDNKLYAMGSIIEANQSPGVNYIGYVYSDASNEDNFDVVKNEGRLWITTDSQPVTISVKDYYGVYDGGEHGDAAIVSDSSYSVYYTTVQEPTEQDWTSNVPKIKNAGATTVFVKATKGEVEVFASYTLTVVPKDVSLTSASASKTYDGTALTQPDVSGAEGFVSGEAIVVAKGSITTCGTETNTIEITGKSGYSEDNYNINKNEGTLTVTKATIPIIIQAKSATKVYDGAALAETGFIYNKGSLPANHSVSAYTNGSITDAGTAENKVDAYVIKDAGGNDVSACFDVITRTGKLVVTKRHIVLESASGAKVYDATPLVKNEDSDVVVYGSFADGEGVNITVTGSQTDAGNSANTFDYSFKTNTNANNYVVKKVEGRLVVAKRSVTLSSVSYAKPYDGTALVKPAVFGNDSCTDAVDAVFASQVTDLTASTATKVINVGDVAKNVISYSGIEGVFKSTNYSISKYEGYLAVFDPQSTTQKYIAVGRDYDGLYDGITHTSTAVLFKAPTVTEDLKVWYWNNAQTGWTQDAPSAKDCVDSKTVYVKASKDQPTVNPQENTESQASFNSAEENWNSTYDTKYTLNVYQRQITLESGSQTKVYDGTPLFDKTLTPSGDGFVYGEGLEVKNIEFGTDKNQLLDVVDTLNESGQYVTNNNNFALNDESWRPGTEQSNYNVYLIFGTLNITPIEDPITITADSFAKKYDGAETSVDTYTYTEGILLSGDTLSATVEGGHVTDAGTYATKINDDSIKVTRTTQTDGTKDITANYTFADSEDGLIAIAKRAVSITSASDSKVYDGTPLVRNNPETDITTAEDGFVARDVPVYNITGSQTKVGSSANAFNVSLQNGMDVNENYILTKFEGTLTVTRIVVPIVISVDEVVDKYDGEKHNPATNHELDINRSDDGIVNISDGVIADTDKVVVDTSLDTYEDAGNYENNIIYYDIVDKTTGTSTKENYIVPVPKGNYFKVLPRDIIVTSASAEKEYDGTPLVADGYSLEGDGFVKNQGATFSVTGAQTEVGSSANTMLYTLYDNTKAQNYNVTLNEGSLTVYEASSSTGSATSDNNFPYVALATLLAAISAAGIVIAKRRRSNL